MGDVVDALREDRGAVRNPDTGRPSRRIRFSAVLALLACLVFTCFAAGVVTASRERPAEGSDGAAASARALEAAGTSISGEDPGAGADGALHEAEDAGETDGEAAAALHADEAGQILESPVEESSVEEFLDDLQHAGGAGPDGGDSTAEGICSVGWTDSRGLVSGSSDVLRAYRDAGDFELVTSGYLDLGETYGRHWFRAEAGRSTWCSSRRAAETPSRRWTARVQRLRRFESRGWRRPMRKRDDARRRGAIEEDSGQGTVEYAIVFAALLAIALGLGALWRAGERGAFAAHADQAASHAVDGEGMRDIALY